MAFSEMLGFPTNYFTSAPSCSAELLNRIQENANSFLENILVGESQIIRNRAWEIRVPCFRALTFCNFENYFWRFETLKRLRLKAWNFEIWNFVTLKL